MSQFSDWNELLVRDFGVLLDSELFMADNGKSRCTPCYYVLRQIRFIQRSLFFSVAETFFYPEEIRLLQLCAKFRIRRLQSVSYCTI